VSRPERSFGEVAVASDHVGGKNFVRNKPVTLAGKPGRKFVEALSGPWR
jgi:hypothetical protein